MFLEGWQAAGKPQVMPLIVSEFAADTTRLLVCLPAVHLLLGSFWGACARSIHPWLMPCKVQHLLRLCMLPMLRVGLLLQVRIAVVGEGTGKCIRAAGQPDLLSLEYTATVVNTVRAALLGIQAYAEACVFHQLAVLC